MKNFDSEIKKKMLKNHLVFFFILLKTYLYNLNVAMFNNFKFKKNKKIIEEKLKGKKIIKQVVSLINVFTYHINRDK